MLGESFDPKAELLIHEHCRPHWSQAGAIVFITFRTHDSAPREVLERWEREKQAWIVRHITIPQRRILILVSFSIEGSPGRRLSLRESSVPAIAQRELISTA